MDSFRQIIVICDDRTTFQRVEELGPVKAEYLRIAERAYHPAIVRTGK